MNLGTTLKKLLEQHNISQKDLARDLFITPSTLGNYIQNTREPDYQTLIKIADYFHVTIDFLLEHDVDRHLTQEEILLINTFRSLTDDQKEFYLEQGKIFINQNNKKTSTALKDEDTKLESDDLSGIPINQPTLFL